MVVLRVRSWECSKGSVSCGIDQNWPSVCACSLYLPVLSTFFVAPWYNRKLTPQGGTTFVSVSPLARSQNSVFFLTWGESGPLRFLSLSYFQTGIKKLLKEENEMMFISNLFNFVLELYLVSIWLLDKNIKYHCGTLLWLWPSRGNLTRSKEGLVISFRYDINICNQTKTSRQTCKKRFRCGVFSWCNGISQNIHEKSTPTDVYREIDILILGLSYMYTPSLRVTTIEPRRTLAFIAKCSRSWGRSGQVIESPICQRMRNKSL